MPGHLWALWRRNTIRREKEGEARTLRGQGFTFEVIADKLGVNEKTVRRWLKGEGEPSEARKQPVSGDWPEDRTWPGWTATDLKAKLGGPPEASEATVTIVKMAEAVVNRHIPWYYRRLVELSADYPLVHKDGQPNPYDDWAPAIVGLPVLADWLDSSECTALASLIHQQRPWESPARRKTYAREARPVAERIKARALQVCAWLVMAPQARGQVGTLQLLVAIETLMQRMPMFDEKGSPPYDTQSLILVVLSFPKGGKR